MKNKLSDGSNMRWESMRMILPEQREALKQMELEDSKIPRPILDEYELQEIGQSIQDAFREHKLIEITYYKDGFIKRKICYISKLDSIYKRLTVSDMYGLKWSYEFNDIVNVKIK